MKFWHTLTFRVLVGSCLLLLALFGFYSYLAVRFHTSSMSTQVIESAGRVSDIIKNSTRYSMLLNRREDVFQIINTIGKEPGVEGIRIYNKRGEIMFSTAKEEEGSVVDMHAEACFACHDSAEPFHSLYAGTRSRVYTNAKQVRIVGTDQPDPQRALLLRGLLSRASGRQDRARGSRRADVNGTRGRPHRRGAQETGPLCGGS